MTAETTVTATKTTSSNSSTAAANNNNRKNCWKKTRTTAVNHSRYTAFLRRLVRVCSGTKTQRTPTKERERESGMVWKKRWKKSSDAYGHKESFVLFGSHAVRSVGVCFYFSGARARLLCVSPMPPHIFRFGGAVWCGDAEWARYTL